MRPRRVGWLAIGAVFLFACGDGDGTADAGDAAPDAGSDAGDAAADASRDTDPPPPLFTGCSALDGGLPDAGQPSTECTPFDAGAFDAAAADAGPGAGDGGSDGAADAGADAGEPAPIMGPGGPAASFADDELETACAYLDGGETDRDHHNTVLMIGGYLWMPWAHEAGGGGISVFEFDDPCDPVHVATVTHEDMRETHAAGAAYIDGRRWMVTASLDGIMFWDITDPNAIRMVADLPLPCVTYPDSYARVVMSTYWQAPYVYVGASDNGVFVVDASDPTDPELVSQYKPGPRVGGVHAIGTTLVVFPSEGTETVLLDVSHPASPRPIPGMSEFETEASFSEDRPMRTAVASYFSHLNGNRTYHARSVLGGGLVVYDIADPSAPERLGSYLAETGANGGYVFVKDDYAYVGLSGFAEVIDVSDPTDPTPVAQLDMQGDFDTLVPIGNVVVGSVDDDAVPGQASAVFPFEASPDSEAPEVNMVVPKDGTRAALSARVGLTFDEFVEMETVGPETLVVREAGTDEALAGWYSGQEGAVSFWPEQPLRPDTRYEIVVPADGIEDYSGNATAETFRSTFVTARCD